MYLNITLYPKKQLISETTALAAIREKAHFDAFLFMNISATFKTVITAR